MRRSPSAATVLMMVIAGLSAGCHHRAVTIRAQPALAGPSENYCWWTLLRTALPPDSVAARFQLGFTAIGLTGATWTRSADTVWVHAGPTPLERGLTGAMYAGRAVAYRQGDSTNFRYYVAIAPPAQEQAQTGSAGERPLPNVELCGQIAQASAIPSSRPRRDPNGEDSLEVWRRRP